MHWLTTIMLQRLTQGEAVLHGCQPTQANSERQTLDEIEVTAGAPGPQRRSEMMAIMELDVGRERRERLAAGIR